MSYAEYGERIFLPQRFKTEKFLIRDEEIAQVRSGHRLKVYDSFLDIRAWSPKQLETFRYFRDVTENQSMGKIVPIDYLIEIINDLNTQSELALLREELERYRSLKLTSEQKEQLLNLKLGRRVFTDDEIVEIDDKSYEAEELNDENSRTFISEESEFTADRESNLNTYSRFTSTESLSQDNKAYDSDEISQVPSNSLTMDDEVTLSNRSFNSQTLETQSLNSERTRIIKNESMIIALENDLGVKKAELNELKEMVRNFQTELKNREVVIKNLQDHTMNIQRQLKQVMTERNSAIEEYKKISDGKNLIDQLKTKLEEKRYQCSELSQELEKSRHINHNEELRAERDSLNRTLDEIFKLLNSVELDASVNGIRKLVRERHELIASEKHLHIECLEREEEVSKLSKLMDRMCNENQNRQADLKRVIDNLKSEIKTKNMKIEEYKDRVSLMLKDFEDKICHEKLIKQNDVTDENLDKALAQCLRQSVTKFTDFFDTFESFRSGGGDGIYRGNNEIEQIKSELMSTIQELKEQVEKKTNEEQLYHERYEESQRILEIQSEELRKLREAKDKFENNNSLIEELKRSTSQMELKFIELHKEHYNLTNKIQNLNDELSQKNQQIIELETQKDTLSCKVKSSAIELKERDERINVLRNENSRIEKKLKEAEENAAKIENEMKELKHESEILNQLSFLQKEIVKCGKDKQKLEENITNLRHEFKTCRSSNRTLDENLNDKVREKESLQNKISVMKQNISHLSNELKFSNFDGKNIMELPLKLSESISLLKKRLHVVHSPSEEFKVTNEKDVEEYQSQLFGQCNEGGTTIRKSEMFFKRNMQYVEGSKEGMHRVQFVNDNDKLKSVLQNESDSNLHKNERIIRKEHLKHDYDDKKNIRLSEAHYYPQNTPTTKLWPEKNNLTLTNEDTARSADLASNDLPKISIFKSPQTLSTNVNPMNVHRTEKNNVTSYYSSNTANQRLMSDYQKTYEYRPRSEMIDTSNKNFITSCSVRRKTDNF